MGRSVTVLNGVAGNDEKHFGRPTDIAWLPDGTFFISDGYTNTRVVKFDRNGKFLMTWGTPGTGPGQFNTVHSIDIDRNRRLYVSDRGNMRIQIFDENGKYLDQFGGLRQPQHVMVTADGHLGIVGGNNNKVTKFDLKGKLITSWGTQGTFPGGLWNMHQFSVDSDGNLYIADASDNIIRKVSGSVPTFRLSTTAGTGSFGSSGDGGPAIQAGVSQPYAVALDPSGNPRLPCSICRKNSNSEGRTETVPRAAAISATSQSRRSVR